MNRRRFLGLVGQGAVVAGLVTCLPAIEFRQPSGPTKAQACDFVRQLMQRAIDHHDDLIEQALFQQGVGAPFLGCFQSVQSL